MIFSGGKDTIFETLVTSFKRCFFTKPFFFIFLFSHQQCNSLIHFSIYFQTLIPDLKQYQTFLSENMKRKFLQLIVKKRK